MASSIEQLKDETMHTVPETVRALLRVAGVRDHQLADGIGVKRNVAQMRRTEASQWRFEELAAIAAWLKVPVALLFENPQDAVQEAVSKYGLAFRFPDRDVRRSTCDLDFAGQGARRHAA